MNIDAAKNWIKHAQDDLDQALRELDDVTPPEPEPPNPEPGDVVRTPEEFDAALAAVTVGGVITCATSLVYPKPLTLTESITIQSEVLSDARMTLDEPAPKFTGGIELRGTAQELNGLEITRAGDTRDILTLTGSEPLVKRCRILGNPTSGAKRGIAANAPNTLITRCYIDYCFGPYPGNDCQAISGWLSAGPITITDCYLCGGTETIMFGGGDPPSEDCVPCDVYIARNTITKRPEWQTQAVSVKNTLELKNAKRVRIEDNDISQSWGGHGQDGYLLMLTPRNQDGGAPYSGVVDVEILNNRFSCGAAAINMLGEDNNHPSQRLARIVIRGNRFEQLDPKLYTGTNKMIMITRGPADVTLDENVFAGVNIGSQIYFGGTPQCEQLVVTDNVFPSSKYGVFGDNCSTGNGSNGLPNAWNTYVASGTFSGNTTTPPAADDEYA